MEALLAEVGAADRAALLQRWRERLGLNSIDDLKKLLAGGTATEASQALGVNLGVAMKWRESLLGAQVSAAFRDVTASYGGLTGPALTLEAGASVPIPRGLSGAGQVAIVREVYLQLRERLLAMMPGGLACVYGTPGVGTSIFASLFLLSLTGSDHGSVFYTAFGTETAQSAWCLRGGAVFEVPDGELTRVLANADGGDQPSWLVVDGRQCDTFVFKPSGSLRIVLASSANLSKLKWLHELDKLATLKLLMPPFSCSELEHIPGAALNVAERFAEFGGSARLVLGQAPCEGWARQQVRGLGANVLEQIRGDVEEGSKTERASSRILHLFPDASLMHDDPHRAVEYDRRIVRYASPAAADAAVSQYWTHAKQEVVDQLEAADLFSDRFAVALLFEPVMHYRLRRGLAFDSEEGAGTFRLPELALRVLNEQCGAARQCPNNAYLQPASKSCAAAIDSVAKVRDILYLFQMTGPKDHYISMNGMLRVFDVPLGTPGAVTYLAPTKKKRLREGGANEDEQLLEERAVLVPPHTTLVFVVTRGRRDECRVPQRYGRGDRVLWPEAMNGAEKHVCEQVQQRKVWAQYNVD